MDLQVVLLPPSISNLFCFWQDDKTARCREGFSPCFKNSLDLVLVTERSLRDYSAHCSHFMDAKPGSRGMKWLLCSCHVSGKARIKTQVSWFSAWSFLSSACPNLWDHRGLTFLFKSLNLVIRGKNASIFQHWLLPISTPLLIFHFCPLFTPPSPSTTPKVQIS